VSRSTAACARSSLAKERQREAGREKLCQNSAEACSPLDTRAEIAQAVAAAQPAPVILLHCVAAYPTPTANANLWRIDSLRRYPGVACVGLSDHSEGELVPMAATAKRVAVIEKHLMLPATMPLDYLHSVTPGGFQLMARRVKETWEACQASGDVEGPSRQFKRRPINGRWLRG